MAATCNSHLTTHHDSTPHRSELSCANLRLERTDGALPFCRKPPFCKPLHANCLDVAGADVMDVPNLVLDIVQIRRDALNGRLSVEQLVNIIEKQQQTIKRQAANEHRLLERFKQYEPQASRETTTNQANSNPPTASYSLDAETKRRQRRRRRKKSPGRQPTAVKFADAEQFRNVYPDGVRHGDCELVRERAVWRIDDGKAVRRGYRIFAGPDSKEPRIPRVTPRC